MKGLTRRPFAPREKAAVLKMRKHGCRIQHIAEFLGRSTSVIHRILRRSQAYGYNLDVWRRVLDMRKMPAKTRLRAARVSWRNLRRHWDKLEAWVLGEGEKPP